MSILFLFVDGLGLGPDTPNHPWHQIATPFWDDLLGGKMTLHTTPFLREDVAFLHTDATLGVSGLPQSATGQTSIFTGQNAAQWMGQHISGFPIARLRRMIEQGNIYTAMQQRGMRCTFANPFSEEFFALRTTQRGWVSASTRSAWSAGLSLRMLPDLLAGQAVSHDLTRHWIANHKPEVPVISPQEAARHMLDLVMEHEFVFHELFLTDTAGHRQDIDLLSTVWSNYDRFVRTLYVEKPSNLTIIMTSDHGNCEDLTMKTHTMHPVPTVILGAGAVEMYHRIHDLTDILPAMLHFLDS